jgi:purine-binding chemotaxis protein CheW
MVDLARRPRGGLRRARQLDRGPVVEYLAFGLAGDPYAAPVNLVREILKPPPLTPVPRAPHAVLGIVSVRGQLVTVMDLRRRLRLVEQPLTRRARILLVEGAAGETIGLFVDEVLAVYRLSESEIEPAATALGNDVAPYIAGIARPGMAKMVAAVAPTAVEPPAAPTRHVPEVAPPVADEADGVIILLDLRAVLG